MDVRIVLRCIFLESPWQSAVCFLETLIDEFCCNLNKKLIRQAYMDLVRVIRPVRHFNICHLLFKEVQAKNVSCALIKIPYNDIGELPEVRGSEDPPARLRGALLLPERPVQRALSTVPHPSLKSMTFGVSLLLSASRNQILMLWPAFCLNRRGFWCAGAAELSSSPGSSARSRLVGLEIQPDSCGRLIKFKVFYYENLPLK